MINKNIKNISVIQISFKTHEYTEYKKINSSINYLIEHYEKDEIHSYLLKYLNENKIYYYYCYLDNQRDLLDLVENESFYKITLTFWNNKKLIDNDIYHLMVSNEMVKKNYRENIQTNENEINNVLEKLGEQNE